MHKLTNDELKEHDVTLTIPYEKYKNIPDEYRKVLDLYIGKDTGQSYIYRIPAYLAREMEQAAIDARGDA